MEASLGGGSSSRYPVAEFYRDRTIITTNNTTALTLDSSQNATFAGSVTVNTTGVFTGSTNQKLSFIPGSSGTYGTANFMRWYRADGTTSRAIIGYGSGNDQRFFISTGESGGSLVFQTAADTTALTLDSSQVATFAKIGRAHV